MKSCPPPIKTTVDAWEFDDISPLHPHFDETKGVFKVPCDGLYTIKLQIIPLDGDVLIINRQRTSVRYAIRLEHPCPKDGDIESVYRDVGSSSFGQLEHLARGTTISCERLPDCVQPLRIRHECLRLGVACIQRKRKGTEQPLSKNERKKRRKLLRRQTKEEPMPSSKESGLENDREWDTGFDSDSSVSEDAVQSTTEPAADEELANEEPAEESTEEEVLEHGISRQMHWTHVFLFDDL